MLQRILRPARKLSQSDLDNFEAKNGIVLPQVYKDFLLKHNGGVPEPDSFPLTAHREGVMDILVFYGIDHQIESLQLQSNFEFHQERFDDPAFDSLFPIGHDSFGDPICLDLSPERYGAVIFIDMVPIWKDHTAKDIYVIANSFSEFLGMLYEVEDDDL